MNMIQRVRAGKIQKGTEEADFSLGTWSGEDMQSNALGAARFMRELIRDVSNKRIKLSLKRMLFGSFEVAVRFDAGDEKAWGEARKAEEWADANRARFGRSGKGLKT